MKGKLIVIEGSCDGAGKTTQIELLKSWFLEEKINFVTHHFPTYNSEEGALIEMYLKGHFGSIKELSPYFVNSLYAIDRKITWMKLEELYNKGYYVLFDRYTTSSLIYQTALIKDEKLKKEAIDYIIDYEYNKLGIQKPDLVILLHVPFDISLQLLENKNKENNISKDLHEKDIEFLKSTYENSIFVSNYLGWKVINCTFNGKLKNKEEINEEIKSLILRNS